MLGESQIATAQFTYLPKRAIDAAQRLSDIGSGVVEIPAAA